MRRLHLLVAGLMLVSSVTPGARADGDDADVETVPPGHGAEAADADGADAERADRSEGAEPADGEPDDTDAAWQEGQASWYGGKFHGRLTASGEVFDQDGLTAAHRWLPLGTRIVVTNLDNGCSVTVRVTDRGPYHGSRILDCSRGAAEELGFLESGVAHVRWDVLQWPDATSPKLRLGFGPPIASSDRPLLPPPVPHEPLPELYAVH